MAQSPVFMNAVDETSAEIDNWVAECRAYAQAMDSRVSSGLASVMGKFELGVSGIEDVEKMKQEYDDITDDEEMDKKAANCALVKEAKRISTRLLYTAAEEMEGEEEGEQDFILQAMGMQSSRCGF